MKAVFYGRYSTDMQRESSIQDQLRNCVKFAERENWVIEEKYFDEAISGSTSDRPQYQKMIDDAKSKNFDVLLVDDLSRLSRDSIEVQTTIKRLRHWQIRIIGVSDGFDSASKGHKIQAGFRGMMNEMFLDDLAEKTHRGLAGQALKGNNCGGRSYGYKHIPIEDPSRKDEYGRPLIIGARREVDPEQADAIRKIFKWYSEGYSPRWIAAELNRLKVPAPRSGSWAQTAIYGDVRSGVGILNNPLYIGKMDKRPRHREAHKG